MAILAHTVRPSLCLSCLQRVLSNDYAPFTGLSYIQIRGKKKMPKKRTTINVRLLQDVKGYGPRGTIVPVSRGLFRNSWLPHRRAEYLSTAQGVNGSKVAAVRDTLFGREEEEEQDRIVTGTNIQSQAAPRVKPTTSVISPERATELLDELLPATLPFQRPLITPQTTSDSNAAVSSAAAALEAAGRPSQHELNHIYGSVSTTDIAEAIRDILADTEAQSVPVLPEQITFLPNMNASSIEGDKVKTIGGFIFEVRVRGGKPVIRALSVQAKGKHTNSESSGTGRIWEEGRALEMQRQRREGEIATKPAAAAI